MSCLLWSRNVTLLEVEILYALWGGGYSKAVKEIEKKTDGAAFGVGLS